MIASADDRSAPRIEHETGGLIKFRQARAPSVVPNQFAAFAFEQADRSIPLGGVENDDHPERLGSAGRAKDIHAIIVSGIAARALVWIGAAHRAPPTQRTPGRVPYTRAFDSVN